jgi:hypothetical protein
MIRAFRAHCQQETHAPHKGTKPYLITSSGRVSKDAGMLRRGVFDFETDHQLKLMSATVREDRLVA